MEFTDESKQTISDLLNAGTRDAALQFISSKYGVSTDDARKLLAAFENQFRTSTQRPPVQTFNLAGCGGFLSGIMKIISVLTGIIGIGTIGFAYLAPDLIGSLEKKINVPVVVTDKVFHSPDSSQVRLIFRYAVKGHMKYDTTNTIYSAGMYQPGDTIRVESSELDIKYDVANSEQVAEARDAIYISGGVALFIALVFWLVSSRFKVKPPSVDAGRYAR